MKKYSAFILICVLALVPPILVLAIGGHGPSFEISLQAGPTITMFPVATTTDLVTITATITDVSGVVFAGIVVEDSAGNEVERAIMYDDGAHQDCAPLSVPGECDGDHVFGTIIDYSNYGMGNYTFDIFARDIFGNETYQEAIWTLNNSLTCQTSGGAELCVEVLKQIVPELSYTTRKKITIDHAKISSNLTDFPVLVKLTTSNFDFTKANVNGYDIRFTDASGVALNGVALKYEREHYTSSGAYFWVSVPLISSSVDTDFYMYYRQTATSDGADPIDTWDSAFKGVWHSTDITTSTIKDSTSNTNNGTKGATNNPQEIAGKIYKAQQFTGDAGYIDLGNKSNLELQNQTVEFWINYANTKSGWSQIIAKLSPGVDRAPGIWANPINGTCLHWKYELGNMGAACVGPSGDNTDFTLGQWYYVVGVKEGTALKIYINGNQVGSYLVPATISQGTGSLYFGKTPNFNTFNGILDEVRFSNTPRTASWIKASYHSGDNTLVNIGSEEPGLWKFPNI